jgi:hypothetical protein
MIMTNNKKVEYIVRFDAFKACADRCGFSVVTIKNAFQYKPVTYQTAHKISKILNIPIECFNIKEDNRGRKPKKNS